MFGYFPDQGTEKARAFLNTASLVDDQVFAIVTDEKVIEELEAEAENVVLYKNVSFIFFKFWHSQCSNVHVWTWVF